MFVISKDGTTAVDMELVTAIRIENKENQISVKIRADGIWLTMATFNSNNEDANYKAAQACLADLVEMLNGGADK